MTPATAATGNSEEAFDLKVKGLEEQVNDLKEKIFRTKARLLLLQETVLGGDITSGARAVIVHRNEMGSSFQLENATYSFDGTPIYSKVDENGDLAGAEEMEVFNGYVQPGAHEIAAKLVFRGRDPTGIGLFSYLEGYRFTVQSSYTFNAEGGKQTAIKIIGYQKGGITAELKDKPAVSYEVEVTRDAHKAGQKPVAASAPSATPATAPEAAPEAVPALEAAPAPEGADKQ